MAPMVAPFWKGFWIILEDPWKSENVTPAAAGTRFGTTEGEEIVPALQRQQHFEGPKALELEKHMKDQRLKSCV